MLSPTANLALERPDIDQGVQEIRESVRDNAEKLDNAVLYTEGTTLPASAPLGSTRYRTDTGDYWRRDAAGWRFERASVIAETAAGGPLATYSASGGVILPLGAVTNHGAPGPALVGYLTGNAVRVPNAGGLWKVHAFLNTGVNVTAVSIALGGATYASRVSSGGTTLDISAVLRSGTTNRDINIFASGNNAANNSASVARLVVERIAP